jgi:hypothetical protein
VPLPNVQAYVQDRRRPVLRHLFNSRDTNTVPAPLCSSQFKVVEFWNNSLGKHTATQHSHQFLQVGTDQGKPVYICITGLGHVPN